MKVVFRAERRAAPKPARLAMCLRLNAASIAVPSGDRPDSLAFSDARMGEGLTFTSESRGVRKGLAVFLLPAALRQEK